MNFFRRNLGALTPISTIRSGGAAPSVAPTVQSGDVLPDPSKFTCTSDQKLVYYNGAWRVRSLDSEVCDAVIATEDTKYVMAQKERIYVGPFQIDLTNTGGQITNLTDPIQIGKDWAAWLSQALTNVANARIAAKLKKDPTFRVDPAYVGKIQMLSLLPHVLGATQDFYDNGTPTGAPVTSDPICADPEMAYYNDASKPGGFCPGARPVPPTIATLASGGHSLYPQVAQFATDAHGFRSIVVQYPDDPNLYSYYTREQWIQALSPDLLKNGVGWLIPGDYLTPANTTQFNRNQDIPPVARFKHPITGEDWGLWVTITAKSLANVISAAWDTSIDAPDSAVMQVAMAPMPQEGWWDDFIDALEWIPISIGEALWDVGQWLSGFVCDLQGQNDLMKKVPPNPYALAAATAALEIANNTQCGKPKTDCKDPAAAKLPQCVVPIPAVIPWWQRWYVIVPALGAVGYGIFKMIDKKNKPRSQPAT